MWFLSMVGQQGGFFHEIFRELFTLHTAEGEAIQHSSGQLSLYVFGVSWDFIT